VPLLALFFFPAEVGRLFLAEKNQAVGLFVGGVLNRHPGIYDDLWGRPRRKFACSFGGGVAVLPGSASIAGHPSARPSRSAGGSRHLLWMVGVINAMNLIDGLDGLRARGPVP